MPAAGDTKLALKIVLSNINLHANSLYVQVLQLMEGERCSYVPPATFIDH